MNINVQTITTKDKKDVFAIRTKVFVEEQHVPIDLELDEYEQEAVHFLASVDDEPAGVARMRWIDDRTAKAERVAVLIPFRGCGVGRELMLALEKYAKFEQATSVKLHAQLTAQSFYERLGYEAFGDNFLDAGIEHIAMRKIF